MPGRTTNCFLIPILGSTMGCVANPAGARLNATPTAVQTPQLVPVETQAPEPEAWEYHFVQSLGLDAPFQSIELFLSDRTSRPRVRLLLIRRPGETGSQAAAELTDEAVCFERVDGATTTFHVRAETPEGPLDWRFEWPEAASPREALRVRLGLYQEPSKPRAVGAAAR